MRVRREFPFPDGMMAFEVEGTREECLEFDQEVWRVDGWLTRFTPGLRPDHSKDWSEANRALQLIADVCELAAPGSVITREELAACLPSIVNRLLTIDRETLRR